MAYSPISAVPIQYSKTDGTPANGYYLKFYVANSSTPISMQTDSGGATSLAKCKLNESGYPISNPNDENTVFIPHLSTYYTAYRFVLYASAADADANNVTSGLPNIQSVEINAAITAADDLRADLAANSGSSLVGFLQAGAGATARTVQNKARESVSVRDFGAVGDGSTDDTGAFLLAETYIDNADGIGNLLVNDGTFITDHIFSKYINIMYDNARIKRTDGTPVVSYPINSITRYIEGGEYAWWWGIACLTTALNAAKKIVFSGDSTTAGVNSVGHTIDIIFSESCIENGINGVTAINAGHSGGTALEWDTLGWVDTDISTHPTMSAYVARWGLNDGTYGSKTLFETHLRAGLTRLRAFKGVDELTIVLMTPNTSFQTLKDEKWIESIVPIIKKAARDFLCVYIDTYAIFSDARNGEGLWLDAGAGGKIHPDPAFTSMVSSLIFDALIKPFRYYNPKKANALINLGSTQTLAIGVNSSTLNGFKFGISYYRATLAAGYPLEGYIKVERSADDILKQTIVGYTSELTRVSYTRYSITGGVWSAWRGLDYNLTPVNSWVVFASTYPSYRKSDDGTVHVEARIKSGALGTAAFTLPVGFRPNGTMYFIVHNQTASTVGTVEVNASGDVTPKSGDTADMIINITFQSYG